MPRLIDRIDAAAGRTPPVLELDVDYLHRRPGPEALVDEEGHYVAGWYERFDGRLNLQDSSALDLALQRWFHLSIDTPRYFVVLNIANLNKAGNTAVLVMDKATGEQRTSSLTGLFPASQVEVSPDLRCFRDLPHRSFIRLHEDDETFSFSLHCDRLHVAGRARHALGPPLVQVTRFQRGRGSLQWYGNFELLHGTLVLNEEVISLPPGCLGSYDRTIGHQRGIQAWNWIAAAGQARDLETGLVQPLGFQVARDRPQAHPRVESKKHAVWVGGQLYKIPAAAFQYEVLDPSTRETSAWKVFSPASEDLVQDHSFFDLVFTPRFHRREEKRLLIARADFNQYYGTVEGRIRVGGREYALEPMFAVTEESLLEL